MLLFSANTILDHNDAALVALETPLAMSLAIDNHDAELAPLAMPLEAFPAIDVQLSLLPNTAVEPQLTIPAFNPIPQLFATITPSTDGDDLIQGTMGNDHISGWKGNDIIYGNGGNDTLLGGEGHDRIYGGDGRNELFGNDGDDQLFGYDPTTFSGFFSDNYMHGGFGDDQLFDSWGDGGLDGSFGNDRLYGNHGNDRLAGGMDNDFLSGGAGNDELWGDDGDDILMGSSGCYNNSEVDVLTGDSLLISTPGPIATPPGVDPPASTAPPPAQIYPGDGSDTFVLGDAVHSFYHDATWASSDGPLGNSYAIIVDFNPAEGDKIQVHGSRADHSLDIGYNAMTDTWFTSVQYRGELIAIAQDTVTLSLDTDFQFL